MFDRSVVVGFSQALTERAYRPFPGHLIFSRLFHNFRKELTNLSRRRTDKVRKPDGFVFYLCPLSELWSEKR
jgi:hypothetical protein